MRGDAKRGSRMTARDEVLAIIEPDEEVEAVVFGHWNDESDEFPSFLGIGPRPVAPADLGKIMSWKQAEPLLAEFAFGGYRCHTLFIWTDRRVMFVGTYDGATWLDDVPRSPVACKPTKRGGG